MSNTAKCSSVEQFISNNSDLITYNNLSLYDNMENLKPIVVYNVIDDYLDDLIEKTVEVELTDYEKLKYKYRPKLLAYDVYGSTELYFVILLLNNMCDVKEFDIESLKLLTKDDMRTLLSFIYNAEHKAIVENRDRFEV